MNTARRLSVCLFAAMALSAVGALGPAAEPARDVGYFLKRLQTLDH